MQLLSRLVTKPELLHLDDVVFAGGLAPGAVVELSGDEACGKSQYLVHVLAGAVLPHQWKGVEIGGQDLSVVLVDNSYSFNLLRLITILEQRLMSAVEAGKLDKSRAAANSAIADDQDESMAVELESCVRHCINKLLIVRCQSSAQFLVTLCSLESLLAARGSFRVVLIDSVDSFLDSDKFNKTESRFTHCINILRKLVSTHRLVVMATRKKRRGTQKGFKRDHVGEHKTIEEDIEYFTAWRHLVNNTRILSRDYSAVDNTFCISSCQQDQRTVFIITETGISFHTPAAT